MDRKDKKLNIIKSIFKLIIAVFFVKIFWFIFKNRKDIEENIEEFVEEEKEEVEELIDGKESFGMYCKNSFCLFKNYFIPNDGNGHKPKILHTKSLLIIAIALIIVKSVVTGYLFFIYPNQARMSEIILSRMFELTNISRVENGLAELSLNSVLNVSAEAKAQDMIDNNYFAHHSPDGKKPWDWISRSNYPYIFVGENLAMNFSSADSAHKALMLSPSHKENILNNRFSDIGLAVVSGEINGEKTNILVELFAAQKEVEITVVEKEPLEVRAESEQVKEDEQKVEKTKIEKNTNILSSQSEEDIINAKENNSVTLQSDSEQQEIGEKEGQFKSDEIQVNNSTNTIKLITSTEDIVGGKVNKETVSPNKELEFNPNTEITYINQGDIKELNAAATFVKISKYLYIAVLVLLIISLLANIFVRITIQHKPAIIQTIILIIFIAGLISIHFHFLEKILGGIAVI